MKSGPKREGDTKRGKDRSGPSDSVGSRQEPDTEPAAGQDLTVHDEPAEKNWENIGKTLHDRFALLGALTFKSGDKPDSGEENPEELDALSDGGEIHG